METNIFDIFNELMNSFYNSEEPQKESKTCIDKKEKIKDIDNKDDDLLNFDFNGQELDLSKKEDVEYAHKLLDQLKDNQVSKSLLDLINVNLDDLGNIIDDLFDTYQHKQEDSNNHKCSPQCSSNKKSSSNIKRQVKDMSIEEEPVKDKIVRPSSKLPVNIGLQIHRLTQEYIDKYVRPYKTDTFNEDKINDVYAALYEFASWIYTK